MGQSLFWHDYETSGVNPSLDQPLQFAGIRTNESLEIIDDPVLIYCKPHLDIIPSPVACLVTKISPQIADREGLKEPEFIKKIYNEMIKPGTCAVGYNSIKFDDEFTRFTLYRNFFDPYEREWKNGNSRWDIINMMRLARALRPEGIEWPNHDDGKPSFKLEDLTRANGIEHSGAHDALADVYATIELAKLVRLKQPRLFHYIYRIRKKNEVSRIVNLETRDPVFCVSGALSHANMYGSIILPLIRHPINQNSIICWDLSKDPSLMIDSDMESLSEIFFGLGSMSSSTQKSLPFIVHVNRSPVVMSVNVVTPNIAKKLSLDLEKCEDNLNKLLKAKDLCQKLKRIYDQEFPQAHESAETALYSGFIPKEDAETSKSVRNAQLIDLRESRFIFQDKRLNELLFLYRARNFKESLSSAEVNLWREMRRDKLISGRFGVRYVSQTRQEISDLKNKYTSKEDVNILNNLLDWILNLETDFLSNLE